MSTPMPPFDPGAASDAIERNRRIRRAWATAGPPDQDARRSSPWSGLVLGLVVAVLVAAGIGVSGVVRSSRRATTLAAERSAAPVVETPSVTSGAGAGGPSAGSPTAGGPTTSAPSGRPGGTTPTTGGPRPTSGPLTPVTPINPVTPTSPTTGPLRPGPPAPTATSLNAAATFRWQGLGSSGARFVDVIVRPADGSGGPTMQRVPAEQGGATVQGLANGTQYVGTLSTIAADGSPSAPSAPSNPVTPTSNGAQPPVPVGAVGMSAGNSCLTIVWSFAKSGPAPTRWRVTLSPGGAAADMVWAVNGVTIANLDPNVAYTASVVGIDDDGYSTPSTSAPTKPSSSGAGKPGTPTNVSVAKAADGSWTATWTPQSTGGSTAGEYFTLVPLPAGTGAKPTQVGPFTVTPGRPLSARLTGLPSGLGLQLAVVVNGNPGHLSDPSAPSSTFRT